MVKVLIVDDSAVARGILQKGLSTIPGIEVVGTAGDAYSARDKIVSLAPDVMTLDIQMPRMNGIDFLKKLMPQYPLPVVIVSSLAESNAILTLAALEAGAVDYVLKPSSTYGVSTQEMIEELGKKVKMAGKVDVSGWKKSTRTVRRRPALSRVQSSAFSTVPSSKIIIAIGASTGGTEALRQIITELPPSIPGVIVVQHMPPVFTKLFADSLNGKTRVRVKEARERDRILPGQVLIAPGGVHLELEKTAGVCRVSLKDYEKVSGHKPSIDVLFNSVAHNCCPKAVGVELTGMGHDGAAGLLAMRQKGARTFAQDEKTSVVFGMPRIAYENGGAEKCVPLENIAGTLVKIVEEMV